MRIGSASLLSAGACAPVYPPVADIGGDLAFKARIAETFGPGSPAARLRAALLADGFTILDEPRTGFASALFRPSNLPCYTQVRIDWREDRRGRVMVIQAGRQACT